MSLSLELQFTLSLKASLPVCHSKEMLLATVESLDEYKRLAVKLYACIFVFSSFDTV